MARLKDQGSGQRGLFVALNSLVFGVLGVIILVAVLLIDDGQPMRWDTLAIVVVFAGLGALMAWAGWTQLVEWRGKSVFAAPGQLEVSDPPLACSELVTLAFSRRLFGKTSAKRLRARLALQRRTAKEVVDVIQLSLPRATLELQGKLVSGSWRVKAPQLPKRWPDDGNYVWMLEVVMELEGDRRLVSNFTWAYKTANTAVRQVSD